MMLLFFDQNLAQHFRRNVVNPGEDFDLPFHVTKNDPLNRDRRGSNSLLSREAGKKTKRDTSKAAQVEAAASGTSPAEKFCFEAGAMLSLMSDKMF